jgi:hypothetical protein
VIRIPLNAGDADVPLDLQESLVKAYDRSGCDLQIDYSRDPVPPLSPEDAAWARELLDGH